VIAGSLALGCKPEAVEDPQPSTAPILVEREPVGPRFVDGYVDTNYGCAVERGGKLWCWGEDPADRLGMRPRTDAWHRASPVRDLEPAIAVAGDFGTTCILFAEGRVRCWQLPSRSRPQGLASELVPMVEDAVDLVVANGRLCVRREGGEVECSTIRGAEREQVASGAIDFEFSARRKCSLDAEGGIWCWDSFAHALIADAQTKGRKLEIGPTGELLMARIPGAVEIEVGESNGDVVVRTDEGEVRIEPQVGFDSPLPVPEYRSGGIDDATSLAFAEGHGCVVTRDAEVRCFGGNGWAQLGDGGSGVRSQPVLVPGIADAHGVFASRSLSCALHGDGISCWGTKATQALDTNVEERHVATRDAVTLVADRGLTCASLRSGEDVCWGTTSRTTPFEVDPRGIFASSQPSPLPFAFGQLRERVRPCFLDDTGVLACGLMRDPEGAVQGSVAQQFEEHDRHTGVRSIAVVIGPCWIDKSGLQCKDENSKPRATPKLKKPTLVAGGEFGYCVVHDRGKLGCFAPIDDSEPAISGPLLDVPISDVEYIVQFDRCFGTIDARGLVQTFCLDRKGDALELRALETWPLENVVELVPTRRGMCGRTKDGQLACLDKSTEKVTLEFTDVIDIAGDLEHTCVLQADGTVTCIGRNRFGELGALPSSVMAQPRAIEFVE
jgi:hypothetical protein